MDKMLELEKRIHLIARLPPPEVLARAFNQFIASRKSQKLPMEDFHVARLIQTFKTIEEQEKEDGSKGPLFTHDELISAMMTLSTGSEGSLMTSHTELVRLVHEKLVRAWALTDVETPVEKRLRGLSCLVFVLSQTGEAKEAQNILQEFWTNNYGKKLIEADRQHHPWGNILSGFALEDNEEELLRTIETMNQLSVPLEGKRRLAVALFYARKDNIEGTKKWFDGDALTKEPSTPSLRYSRFVSESYKTLFEFCLRNNEIQWGQSVLQASRNSPDSNLRTWNAIFQASAASGKGVEDIDRMIEVMMRRNGEASPDTKSEATSKPDISIFNGLIQYAVAKQDSYYAERYFSLITKWGAVPNAQTYIFQIQYRLKADDIDGALASYALLREQDIVAHEDWPIMNQLTQHLARHSPSTPQTHQQIMSLVADLTDRKLLFPSATVAALCAYHLHRDEYFELVDLLQNFAHQYSIRARHDLLSILSSAALDPTSDTSRAWDTYMIFHQVFDLECTRSLRAAVMFAMFARRRPDLATHVFTRMARHPRRDTRPDAHTYALALCGIADCAEPEALEVVHNMLKLDTETEPDARLLTALMAAYNAVGAPDKALGFWAAIATSAEGPCVESLHAAFRACERLPYGHVTARGIFARLREGGVEIGRDLVASYVGALSGNRMFEDAGDVIERVQEITGGVVRGDGEELGFVLGTFFNAATGTAYQHQIEEWCADRYPEIWGKLVEDGFMTDEMGFKLIKGIDRRVRVVKG